MNADPLALLWKLRNHPLFKAYLAFAAVCFFWGTTYLGIRMALESFPPLVLVCLRFSISGSILCICAIAARARMPRGWELFAIARNGLFALGIGSICLTMAEVWIPSGTAALFITTSPFWMVTVSALLPRGDRLHAPTLAGVLIGFAGTGLLFGPDAMRYGIGGNMLKGFLVLQVGCAGWSIGSILQKTQETSIHPVVTGGIQQLATGLLFLPIMLVVPETPIKWSPGGIGALVYLATFGSIVGYTSYVYALSKLPVALVSTYTYINPIVAVALGWLFYREPFGWTEATAMAIIFFGVAFVKRFSTSREVQETHPASVGTALGASGAGSKPLAHRVGKVADDL